MNWDVRGKQGHYEGHALLDLLWRTDLTELWELLPVQRSAGGGEGAETS